MTQAQTALTLTQAQRSLIQTDSPGALNNPILQQQAMEIAEREGVPLSGLALLGGKFYINATGLDVKIDALCAKRNLEKSRVEAEFISDNTDEDGIYRCGFRGIVELFDKSGFMKTLELLKGNALSPEFLKDLRNDFTYRFVNDGWAGHASVKMSTMKNPDFLRMMAATRALNRAKRLATGTGLTSMEEMDVEVPTPQATGRVERYNDIVQQPQESASPVAGQPVAVPETVVAGTLSAGPTVSQTTVPAPRKLVYLNWFDADTAEMLGHIFESDFREEVGKFATWLPGKNRFVIDGMHSDDVFFLCEKYGYELEEDRTKKGSPFVSELTPTPVKAKTPDGMKRVNQFRGLPNGGPKKSSKGTEYYEVEWGGVWYWLYRPELFEYIRQSVGKLAMFSVTDDPKYPKITGIYQIAERQFDSDGMTPVLDVNEDRKGKLF